MSEHTKTDSRKRPPGCVCANSETWPYLAQIPAVCAEFSLRGDGECGACEHDKECHRAPEATS